MPRARSPADIRIVLDRPVPGVEDAIRCLREVERRGHVKFGELLALLDKFMPGGTEPNKVCLASIRAYPPVARLRAMIGLAILLVAKEFVIGLDLKVRSFLILQSGAEPTFRSA